MIIILKNRLGEVEHEVQVEPEKVAFATMLIFQGVHYAYQHQAGPFFTKPVFVEAKPPVKIG